MRGIISRDVIDDICQLLACADVLHQVSVRLIGDIWELRSRIL